MDAEPDFEGICTPTSRHASRNIINRKSGAPNFAGKGLLICTPTSRHASSNIINSKTVKSVQPVFMDQGTTPVSVLSVGVAVRAPIVSPSMITETVMRTPAEIFIVTAPTTMDNQQRVACDSEGQCNLAQASALCTNDSRTATRTCRLRDLRQLPAGAEADDAHNRCKYVDIEQRNENETPDTRDIYHQVVGAPAGGGKLPNWSRVVKLEAISLDLEESWPPLMPSTRKEELSKTDHVVDPIVNAQSQCENLVVYSSSCQSDDQFRPNTKPVQNSQEVMLDELCWPSLEKFNKRIVIQHDYGVAKKRALQPLQHSNISTEQDQRRVAHRGIYKAQNMHFPPILLMVNKDFIVTSPLKENLLLTLALMGRTSRANAPEDVHAQILEGTEAKRQVLVGQFKAFSSFLHFMLGQDATRVRTESNAGGTSTISECLSVEYFVRRFQARDIVTEMEVEYCSYNWKKVDYICTLYGQRVGISVTRAMSFPDPKDFSAEMAYRLLHKKLFGLVVARHGVSKRHSFSQCILHVWCETQQTADLMQGEYDAVSRELDIADDVVMVLTVADGYHARPIFYESLLRNELK